MRGLDGSGLLSRRAAIARVVGLVLLIGAIAAAVMTSGGVGPERVREVVDDFGVWAPLAFIAVSAILGVGFFPGPFLAAAAGLMFGPVMGVPVSLCAAVVGAVLAFIIARHTAHDAVDALQGPRLARLRAWMSRRGFVAVLYARLIPGVPFTTVSYAGGLSGITLRAFALATALGAAPRTYAYVTLGGTWGDWGSPASLVAMATIVVLAVVGIALVRRDRASEAAGHPRATG